MKYSIGTAEPHAAMLPVFISVSSLTLHLSSLGTHQAAVKQHQAAEK